MKKIEVLKSELIKNFLIFALCLILVYIIAIISFIFSLGEDQSFWYLSTRPAITPPNIVFPIVWAAIYIIIALSLYSTCMSSAERRQKTKTCVLFGIILILNTLWIFAFYKLENAITSFVCLLLLIALIIITINETNKCSKIACYLLLPYLIWIIFLSIINFLFISA